MRVKSVGPRAEVKRFRKTLRRRGAALLVVVTAVVAQLIPASPASGTTSSAQPSVLFGAVIGKIPWTKVSNVTSIEAKVGRKMAVLRMYASWNTDWPDPVSSWAHANRRLLLLSVKSKTTSGTVIPWATVAAAQPGSAVYDNIVRWADGIKAFRGHIYFTFNHEPDASASDGMGTPAEYVAAWRRIVTIFRERAATNAEFLWIVTGAGFNRVGDRNSANFYPGDDVVDALGVDVFNWYTCRETATPWRSMASLIERFRQFANSHPGKPLMLPEYGSVEDPAQPERKAQWYRDAQALFQQPGYERFTALSAFYPLKGRTANCSFAVISSDAALDAFKSWGADPYYSLLDPAA